MYSAMKHVKSLLFGAFSVFLHHTSTVSLVLLVVATQHVRITALLQLYLIVALPTPACALLYSPFTKRKQQMNTLDMETLCSSTCQMIYVWIVISATWKK